MWQSVMPVVLYIAPQASTSHMWDVDVSLDVADGDACGAMWDVDESSKETDGES